MGNISPTKLEAVIKKVFSSNFQTQLRGETILGSDEICNTEYEGEIAEKGDKVQIIYPGNLAVFDSDGKSDLPDPTEPDAAATEMEVTECPAVNFILPMKAQIQVYNKPQLITEWTESAAQGVSEHLESNLASLYTEASLWVTSLNGVDGSSVATLTKDTAYDALVDMQTVFDNAKIPSKGRFAALPPEFIALFAKDPRFITYKASGDKIMSNGFVGTVAGFEVYKDIYCAKSGNNFYPLFGVKKKSIARAMQKKFALEQYKPEKKPAGTIAFKGHALYGYKLLRPDMTGTMPFKLS